MEISSADAYFIFVLVFVLALSVFGYLFYRDSYDFTWDEDDHAFSVLFLICGICSSLCIVYSVVLLCLGG